MEAQKPKAKAPQDTERVVLEHVRVVVVPTGAEDKFAKAIESGTASTAQFREAWVPVLAGNGPKVFKGSKREVIEAHAGKGEGAKPGIYKAPNLSSWKGGRKITVPEKPKAEAADLED